MHSNEIYTMHKDVHKSCMPMTKNQQKDKWHYRWTIQLGSLDTRETIKHHVVSIWRTEKTKIMYQSAWEKRKQKKVGS